MGTRGKTVKGVEIEISEKTLKVGKKHQKPKSSKIRQKSNFAPMLMSRMSKFSEEQDLSDKLGQTSVATIFKFARFIMANLKIVATLI